MVKKAAAKSKELGKKVTQSYLLCPHANPSYNPSQAKAKAKALAAKAKAKAKEIGKKV